MVPVASKTVVASKVSLPYWILKISPSFVIPLTRLPIFISTSLAFECSMSLFASSWPERDVYPG